MLVLSRKRSESVQIDSTIQITILSISNRRVKIGIRAPNDVQIVRNELVDDRRGVAVTPEGVKAGESK